MEATFVRDLDNFTGTAKLWRLSEPYDVLGWDDEVRVAGVQYVVTSAAHVPFGGTETYVFPCDENGDVLDWGELPGSLRGTLDHDEAMAGFLADATSDALAADSVVVVPESKGLPR